MASKSKLKGSAFESKIKKIFTDHFKIQFERVPLSGALPYIKGDIWCPKHLTTWPYVIECKHYKELTFKNMLWAKSNELLMFWQQVLDEAKQMKEGLGMDKKPLVIFRWDRGKDMIMWNDDIEVENQFTYQGFGYHFKIAELENWLPKIKINIS